MTKISLRDSALCAARGLFKSISNERNIKIQLLIGSIIILTGVLVGISKTYLITIIIVVFLVVILEMFNRGFEKLIDLLSPEYNKEFGKVKDIMAGVVLLTFIMAAVVSTLILFQPVINYLKFLSNNPLSLVLLGANIFLCLVVLLAHYIRNKN